MIGQRQKYSRSFGRPSYLFKSNVPVGIDLGTTNSCVAVLEGATPKVVANEEGQRTTPSIVAFTEDGQRLVGLLARRQALLNPENTIFGAKRLIGRKFSDKFIQAEKDLLSFKVAPSKTGDAWIQTKDGELHSPSAIGAMVLGKMRNTAEKYLGDTVEDVVVTVPAYFNDSQRQATKDAGSIAGLNVVRIINEPTAAALSYGFSAKDLQDGNSNQTIAVYDLGGGTFDISILDIQDGVFEVRATNGNTHLGGEDADVAIMSYMMNEFKKQSGVDISSDKQASQRLKEAAEIAKVELSTKQSTEVHLPYLGANAKGPVHLNINITRSTLERLIKPIIDKTIGPVKKCMKDANLDSKKIDKILLVGGMTRIPAVQKAVKDIFGMEPSCTVNPDEAVALGAAIQGAVLKGDIKDVLLLDVTPLSLGIETLGGTFTRLIHRNTTVPVRKSEVFSTCADNQSSVSIRVFQGERGIATKNKHLGEFELVGIPPVRRGIPQIEVSFNLDANGILSVGAKDLGSGKEQSIKIKASGGLNKDEIEDMILEAEKFRDQDKMAESTIEKKNEATRLMLAVEEQITVLSDKITETDKKKLQDAIEKVKSVMDSDDPEEIGKASTELQDISWAISKSVYTKPNEDDDDDED